MGVNPNPRVGEYETSPYEPKLTGSEDAMSVSNICQVITGAYVGNGSQGGQVILLGGTLQYLKIMRTRSIPTPGYLAYSEKYDVWFDEKEGHQYWIEYRTIEGKGITCNVHETYIDDGIFFQPVDGFGVLGFSPALNAKGEYYTYFAVLDYSGMPKKTNYHIPSVDK